MNKTVRKVLKILGYIIVALKTGCHNIQKA